MTKVETIGAAVVAALKSYLPPILQGLTNRVEALEKAEDRKEVDPVEIAKAVAEAVEAIPKPQDGKSVTLEEVTPFIEKALGDALSVAETRLDEKVAEACAAIPVPTNGIDGKDGTSVTVDDVLPVLEARLLEEVAALPTPENGKDGTSVTLDDVRPLIEQAVAAIPVPVDGVDGKDGTSVTVDDVLPLIEEKVAVAVAAIPVPTNGKDGVDGTNVSLEDVAPLIELAVAKGLVDLERRASDVLQRACEAIPKPKDGERGADGFGFEHMELAYDGERLLTLSFKRGDEVKEFPIQLPIPIYRGLFVEGKTYQRGDNVTWAGATWMALKDEPAGAPGSGEADWKEAVRRGDRGKKGEVLTLPATYKFEDKK